MFYISFSLTGMGHTWNIKFMDGFGERLEGKKLLSRPRGRREDNTVLKFNLKTGWHGVYLIHKDQDMDNWEALKNTIIGLWVP